MAYGAYYGLARRIASNKVLHDKPFDIWSNS